VPMLGISGRDPEVLMAQHHGERLWGIWHPEVPPLQHKVDRRGGEVTEIPRQGGLSAVTVGGTCARAGDSWLADLEGG